MSWHINCHNATGFWVGGGGGGRGCSLLTAIEDTREETVPCVWFSVPTRSVQSTPSHLCVRVHRMHCAWFTVLRHASGIYHADLIFEEEVVFWQDRAPPHF
jgi:hypothetical protein